MKPEFRQAQTAINLYERQLQALRFDLIRKLWGIEVGTLVKGQGCRVAGIFEVTHISIHVHEGHGLERLTDLSLPPVVLGKLFGDDKAREIILDSWEAIW